MPVTDKHGVYLVLTTKQNWLLILLLSDVQHFTELNGLTICFDDLTFHSSLKNNDTPPRLPTSNDWSRSFRPVLHAKSSDAVSLSSVLMANEKSLPFKLPKEAAFWRRKVSLSCSERSLFSHSFVTVAKESLFEIIWLDWTVSLITSFAETAVKALKTFLSHAVKTAFLSWRS